MTNQKTLQDLRNYLAEHKADYVTLLKRRDLSREGNGMLHLIKEIEEYMQWDTP